MLFTPIILKLRKWNIHQVLVHILGQLNVKLAFISIQINKHNLRNFEVLDIFRKHIFFFGAFVAKVNFGDVMFVLILPENLLTPVKSINSKQDWMYQICKVGYWGLIVYQGWSFLADDCICDWHEICDELKDWTDDCGLGELKVFHFPLSSVMNLILEGLNPLLEDHKNLMNIPVTLSDFLFFMGFEVFQKFFQNDFEHIYYSFVCYFGTY